MINVLITGGAGFLGRGILRRAEQFGWRVTVYSRDEQKQDLTRRKFPDARYVLGDIRDIDRLTTTMVGHDVVIHAAAIKFVDKAELNAFETISVNLTGSYNVCMAAKSAGVSQVVGLSTDKAVQPVNIYGASKMAMERMFSEASIPGMIDFVCVRYGNVVGSTGSVIPLFRHQYETEGEVRLTNPNMTRFWMGIDEAIDLILIALNDAQPGTITVPMAKAMKMSDVVSAAVPETTLGDIPIKIIGERPGEKMDEHLIHYQESIRVERYADHFEILPPGNSAGVEPFTLSSNNPHYWMEPDEMKKLIEDAKTI